MSIFLPRAIKLGVAQCIERALSQYAQFEGYRVARVTQDGADVRVLLKDDKQQGTYMLNITVKEVR